jgi:hypothetical protein
MVLSPSELRRQLHAAGIANAAVDAAWPQWWSDDAEASLSATAELTYTVARKLGLSASALMGGDTSFIWRDEAQFKNLSADDQRTQAALTSFGVSLTRILHAAYPSDVNISPTTAEQLRDAILADRQWVDTESLLLTGWSLGIPVVQLRVFPLEHKGMHAMTARAGQRYALMLGREASYISAVAFTIAHEMGHIFLGHLEHSRSVVEVEDPLTSGHARNSPEELGADAFALSVLTGTAEPEVYADSERFTATQLADSCLRNGRELRIEPGVLALCLAHSTGKWEQAFGALKIMQGAPVDVGSEINRLARRELALEEAPSDAAHYIENVLGLGGQTSDT